MKETIYIESPSGRRIRIEVKDSMFYIGEKIFMFISIEELIKTAKLYL